MKMHTTFRIVAGRQIISAVEDRKRSASSLLCRGAPYYIMGNGSNLLVGDKDFGE